MALLGLFHPVVDLPKESMDILSARLPDNFKYLDKMGWLGECFAERAK